MTQVKSDKSSKRYIGQSALIVVILSIIWLIVSVSISSKHFCNFNSSLLEKVEQFKLMGLMYYFYNAISIVWVVSITALFTALRVYFRKHNYFWADFTAMVLPIFTFGAVFIYAIQLFFIPMLLNSASDITHREFFSYIVSHLMSDCSGSFAHFIISIAFAAVGAISLIFGFFIFYKAEKLAVTGGILAISGAVNIVAISGFLINNYAIVKLQIGGIILLIISIIPLSVKYLKGEDIRSKIV